VATTEPGRRRPLTRPSRQCEAVRRRRALIRRSPVSGGTTHGRGGGSFTAVVGPTVGKGSGGVRAGGVGAVGVAVALDVVVLVWVVVVVVVVWVVVAAVAASFFRWSCTAIPFGATGVPEASMSW
jgi:hypothetical protein